VNFYLQNETLMFETETRLRHSTICFETISRLRLQDQTSYLMNRLNVITVVIMIILLCSV